MKKEVADIHIERLDTLFNEIVENQEDFVYSLKRTKNELWGLTSDLADKSKHSEYKLNLWHGFCQEMMEKILASLQAMSDELDDIKEELNENDNADAERMLRLP